MRIAPPLRNGANCGSPETRPADGAKVSPNPPSGKEMILVPLNAPVLEADLEADPGQERIDGITRQEVSRALARFGECRVRGDHGLRIRDVKQIEDRLDAESIAD